MNAYLDIAGEIAEALEAGRPIVALESTIISHGMPWPKNLDTALEVEDVVRRAGAVPATVAIVGGPAQGGTLPRRPRTPRQVRHRGGQSLPARFSPPPRRRRPRGHHSGGHHDRRRHGRHQDLRDRRHGRSPPGRRNHLGRLGRPGGARPHRRGRRLRRRQIHPRPAKTLEYLETRGVP